MNAGTFDAQFGGEVAKADRVIAAPPDKGAKNEGL